MNSDDTTRNGVSKDNVPTSSRLSNPDSNANLRLTTDESKGAIPKTRPNRITTKKTNNNVGDLGLDGLKLNGFTKGCSSSGNFLSNSYIETKMKDGERHLNSAFESGLNISIENNFVNGSFPNVHNCEYAPAEAVGQRNVKDDSSSDDNELLSLSDDGCIYTYKGDHVAADLPSLFYNLEAPQVEEIPDPREENASPEMDFLEMDFDPGPSGDADSDSASNAELENATSLPDDDIKEEQEEELLPQPCCSKELNQDTFCQLENTKVDNLKKRLNLTKVNITATVKTPILPVKNEMMPWSCLLSERTKASKSLRIIKRHHNSRGELTSPGEGVNGDVNISNLTSFHGKILIDDKTSFSCDVPRTMIWTHHEAHLKQISQVGPSACGATAVLNVLTALRFPVPTLEKLHEAIPTRLRANAAPLVEYLQSRSDAGCTHRDLVAGLYTLSGSRLYSRFFATHPERIVNLPLWLSHWMSAGAVPVLTLNLQKCQGEVPDSWHHQMVFGAGPEGVYLTNPLECVEAELLWPQLCSESVLMVRREDVISRWNPKLDLKELMDIGDVRWRDLNVVGQVAKVIRESRREARGDCVTTSHVRIPAEYRAGITLVVAYDSPAFTMLRHCPELPLLEMNAAAAASAFA